MVIIAFSCGSIASAQINIPAKDSAFKFQLKNNFHLELGGKCALGSFNFERILSIRKKYSISGGLSLLPIIGTKYDDMLISSISLIVLYGKNKGKLLFGSNAGFIYSFNRGTNPSGDVNSLKELFSPIYFGYNFQPKEKLFYRITLVPLISRSYRPHYVIPWAGIALGYIF